MKPGDRIGADDVRWQDRPVGLIGGTPLDGPDGRTVTSPILAGEVVVAERVGATGIRGPMALAPEHARAVAIAVGTNRPPVAVGDHVDVLQVAADGGSRAQRVAESAVVVSVDDDAITVAVAADELPSTARAALEATAIIALVGAG
jgi:Flp pilus assembly protein CpaB